MKVQRSASYELLDPAYHTNVITPLEWFTESQSSLADAAGLLFFLKLLKTPILVQDYA